jgi:23S rRNA pseudouridine2605 synthase
MAEERLQKILARAGVSSRRAAEALITSGRVRVNGQAVVELGSRADPERDRIEVDGRTIAREHHVYYLLHKPRGMVTTLSDPEGRPSLGELLRDVSERVYPVGRLDFHTSGALLLTNDGDLAQALLHPSRAVPKTYVAKLSREVDDYMLRALESGVVLDDGYRTQPARVEHLRDEEGKSWLQITITEGKNRQIHRMVETLDTRVMRLSRLSFAGLSTEGLRPGALRPLSRDEVASLQREYLPGGAAKHHASPAAESRRTQNRGGDERIERPRAERSSTRSDERASAPRASSRATPRAAPRAAQSEVRKAAARVDSPRSARHKNRPT